ncbi:MAG: plasmid pRiA4b ORF-3 family protein, partial [Bacteroidales bacterium]|nr:plasmid pRiA4b ORF-3 family protein [Bacteroidales bacterium]
MHIYRFRLLSDINDEFVRDIELMASQSFLDFHNMISECVNLNGKELASFHVCDQKWNKMKEITLIDMLDGEDKEEETKPIEETFIMKDSLIKNFIEEPHQRLLYEYDLFNMNTFF